MARKLLVTVWHVLTKPEADRHADVDQVAFKLMIWSWKLDNDLRRGLTTRQFVRYHLMRLDLGHDLESIQRGGYNRPIASLEELLALRPELGPSS